MNKNNDMAAFLKVGKKKGLSPLEIAKINAIVKKENEKAMAEAVDKGFLFACYVFLNVLIADYWQKSAKTKIPKLMKSVLSLYETFFNDNQIIDYDELVKFVTDETGYKIDFEFMREKE